MNQYNDKLLPRKKCAVLIILTTFCELYKKDLHDPDNHHGVITHLEPDTLKSEVSGP